MLIIEIVNKSNLADISDYDYHVRLNYRTIVKGHVKGHVRKTGWIPLMKMILADAEEKENAAN